VNGPDGPLAQLVMGPMCCHPAQFAAREDGKQGFQRHLYRIFGVDLTQISGVHTLTTQTPLAEIGPDLSG